MNAESPILTMPLSDEPLPKKPLPKGGWTGRDLAHFLRTQTILDEDEMKAFADDLEAIRESANQLPIRSWES